MHGKIAKLAAPADSEQTTIERVLLTPERATQLLEANRHNRPLRQSHVNRIAAQIRAGKWRFNGDTIKISRTHEVLDGQHRCWAVVEAQIPIETIIVHGVERDAFATIDTIRAVRSGADVLAINNAARYRPTIATALTWLLRWQRGSIARFRDPANKIENSDIEEAWAAHPEMENAVERAMRVRSVGNPAVFGFAFYVMSNRNAALADLMLESLENPAGIATNDPFFQLRQWFVSGKHRRREPLDSIAVIFKAANAASKRRTLRSLSWRVSGKGAEKFPTLDI